MRDPDPQPRAVAGLTGELADELLHRLLVAAHALHGDDLAVLDGEDRLDLQQLTGHRAGAPDPAALGEKLERVDGEEEAVLLLVAVDQLVELVVGRPRLEPPLHGQTEHGDRGRGSLRVHHPDPAPAELLGGDASAAERARKAARDVERVDPLEPRQVLVDGEEVLRSRLRGRRQLGGGAQARVELRRPELDVVAVALVAEADVERDDAPVRETARRLGKVGGRVDDDRRVPGGQLHGIIRRARAGRPHDGSRPRSRRAPGPSAGTPRRPLRRAPRPRARSQRR